MSISYKDKIKDIYIVFIIVLIGILVRTPFDNYANINTSRLNDPDSYYYARKAIEFVDEPINEWKAFSDRADDSLMNTIDSNVDNITTNFFSMCIAFVCKCFNFLSVNDIIYFFSSVLFSLSVIPIYFFVKKYTNIYGGIVASLSMAIAPSFFMHTFHGFCDTDSMIAILAISLVLFSIDSIFEKSIWKKILLCLGAFASLILFYFVWSNYYVYSLITVGLFIVARLLIKLKKIDCNTLPSTFLIIGIIGFTIVMSGEELFASVKNFFVKSNDWPSPAFVVSEMQKPVLLAGGLNSSFNLTFFGIINWLGGVPFVIVSVFSIIVITRFIFSFFKLKTSSDFEELAVIATCMIVWIAGTLLIVVSGIRFVQLLTLPICTVVGMGVGFFLDTSRSNFVLPVFTKNLCVILMAVLTVGAMTIINTYIGITIALLILVLGLNISNVKYKTLVTVLLIISFVSPMLNEYRIANESKPYASDDLVAAMEYVKNHTAKNSSLVSWWDYGYFYEYESNRHTIADGGIYDGEYFYWLANVFMTDDENLSAGICRMLQNGNIDGIKLAEKYLLDTRKATNMVKEMLVVEYDEAKIVACDKYGLSSDRAEDILEYTHPKQVGDVYLVMYDDIVECIYSMGYFGLWDFEKTVELKVKYDAELDKYIYPKAINNSVIVNYLNKKKFSNFELVYSNPTVSIYRVNKLGA